MTEDQLRAIEARADAATPGPWYAIPNPDWGGAGWRIARDPNEPWANFGQLAYVAPQNGPFIAKAREDIPALVAEVRRLRGQVEALAGLVEEVFDEAYWCCEYDSHGCKSMYQESYWKESESLKKLTAILNGESEGA